MKTLRYLIAAFALCLLSVSADAASRFGVCATTCTWDGSSTAMWSATSGGATGASVPGVADSVTFDGSTCVGGTTCTITVNTNISITSLTFGACTASTTGCIIDFSANNNNVTILTNFFGTGTGTRTLKMGNGVWTFGDGVSNVPFVNFLTTTGLTLNINSSSLVILVGVLGSNNFYWGGKTWGPLTITGRIVTGGTQIVFESGTPASDTFASLTINAPLYLILRGGQNFTFTGGITSVGASWVNPIFIGSDTASGSGGNVGITVGAVSSLAYTMLRGVTGYTSAINVNPGTAYSGDGLGTIVVTNPGGGGGYIIGGQ